MCSSFGFDMRYREQNPLKTYNLSVRLLMFVSDYLFNFPIKHYTRVNQYNHEINRLPKYISTAERKYYLQPKKLGDSLSILLCVVHAFVLCAG